MAKKISINKYQILLLFFTIASLFTSCSSDENIGDNSSNSVELPTQLLGTHTGNLISPQITNESGKATIASSDSNLYTISFSDNVAPITGIAFVPVGKNNTSNFIYTDTDRRIVIQVGIISDNESGLSVMKSNDPIVSFGGKK